MNPGEAFLTETQIIASAFVEQALQEHGVTASESVQALCEYCFMSGTRHGLISAQQGAIKRLQEPEVTTLSV